MGQFYISYLKFPYKVHMFQLWNMGRGPENKKCLDYENIYTPSLYAVMHYKLENEY